MLSKNKHLQLNLSIWKLVYTWKYLLTVCKGERDMRTIKGGLKSGVPEGPFYVWALVLTYKSITLKGPVHITSPLAISHYLLIKGNAHKKFNLTFIGPIRAHFTPQQWPLRTCFLVKISNWSIIPKQLFGGEECT